MSPDQRFCWRVSRIIGEVRLEAILVGIGGAQLHGAPLVAHDLDFLVRDNQSSRLKIGRIARRLGLGVKVCPNPELKHAVRLEGVEPAVDFHFQLSGGLNFHSIKLRAERLAEKSGTLWLASLEDIIRSKEAANRPKDLAALVILRYTADTKAALSEAMKEGELSAAARRTASFRVRRRHSRRNRGVKSGGFQKAQPAVSSVRGLPSPAVAGR